MNALKALMKGNSLSNPAFWKSAQNVVTLSGSIIPVFAIFFPQLDAWLNPDTLVKLYAALGAMNVYLTTATTDKIGL